MLEEFRQSVGFIPQQSQIEIAVSRQKISNGISEKGSARGVILYMRTLAEQLNERVEFFRKRKDWSRTELARQADVPQGYLNELLNQKEGKRWNIDYIEKVAQAFNVPAWQLFIDPREVIPPEYLNLMENYARLDPIRKQIVDDAFAAAAAAEKEKKSDGTNGRS